MHSPVLGQADYQVAVLADDFLSGDIYTRGNGQREPELSPVLGHPLTEVLMVSLLSRGRGVLLHACGVSCEGWGYVFAGRSGAGKSTMARLWSGRDGVSVLSDDRIIVRKQGDGFWAYGTPWHGDARTASPEGVPLERVMIIEHAPENVLRVLSPSEAASQLLVRSFPTFWDADGMAFTLEFLGELAQAVPCGALGFVPDRRVVDFVGRTGSGSLSQPLGCPAPECVRISQAGLSGPANIAESGCT
jgi:hypothetical protein